MQKLIDELMSKSRKALKNLENYNQKQVDELCKAICLAFKENAEILSKEVVEETRLGKYEDKIIKNTGTPDGMWLALKGKKSVGIIKEEPEKGLTYVAHPKGVIVVVAPTTNPNITALCNAVFAIKGRNTVIICSHPRAKKTTKHTVEIMNNAIKKLGAPDNVIQVVEEPSIELTQALMKAADVIVATGGMGMVKSAYSSGVPAFGVGAGNVQTIIDKDADMETAVQQIILGRSFDNGLICAGNQSVIMPAEKQAEIIKIFEKNGTFYTNDKTTIDKFRSILFIDGKINPDVVGQSALSIAEKAGVKVPANTSVIMIQGDNKKIGSADLLCGEKMCPVLIAIPYGDFDEAINIAKTNLYYQGTGHSASIHSNTKANIEKAGVELPVSRLLVNQPGIAAANPFFTNALAPTTTLGCGSWGNNSISENLTYEHLINVSRIASVVPGAVPPTDEELYGE